MRSTEIATAHSDDVYDAVRELVDLLGSTLASDPRDAASHDVLALRRVVRGHPGPTDAVTLSRLQGGRLCLVTAPEPQLGAVRRELAGLLVDSWEDGLLVLVPGLPRVAAEDERSRVARTAARVHRVAPSASVGVSTQLDGVTDAPRGADEAARALALCAPGKVVLADDAWFDVTLSRLRDSMRCSLAVEGPLARLNDDQRTSLAAWLAHDGDVRAAAAELHLHPNSLRYRIRRAGEVSGIDLGDPLQRLVAHLALTSG